MNIDPKLLSQLSSMDPRELSDKISAISDLLGVDPGYIKSLIGSPEEMQKKLQGLSENDIKNMSGRIDPELLKKLKTGEKKNGK
ncbi:MAG: hypothetical protein IJB57_00265 [Clostridia bacterium]|nr:hypothetical protein [Clostridia bacterium]